MKILALVAFLLLAACSDSDQPTGDAFALGADRVDCVVEGADAFARVCTLEQADAADGAILTLRHPSGGFRRLLVGADDQVIAADGAEPAIVSILTDDRIEVSIAGDRYRLPPAGAGR